MWWLLACTSLRGPEGPETLRAALSFDSSYLLLANSYLSCDEMEPDDPKTIEDEAAISIAYRNAQIASAFSREGAFLVAFEYPGDGTWEIGKEASAAWYYVEEAIRFGQDGMIASYLPSEVQKDLQVPAGSLSVKDGQGTFDLEEKGIQGRFLAEPCENEVFRQQLWSQLLQFSL